MTPKKQEHIDTATTAEVKSVADASQEKVEEALETKEAVAELEKEETKVIDLDHDAKASIARLEELRKDPKTGELRAHDKIGLTEEYWKALAKHRRAYQAGNYNQ